MTDSDTTLIDRLRLRVLDLEAAERMAITVADEAFGMGPIETAEETMLRIERGIAGQRQRISELEAHQAFLAARIRELEASR